MNALEFLQVSICCFRAQKLTCTNCGRELCGWHSAGSPVSINDQVVLVPVCFPPCNGAFWKLTPEERNAREVM